MISHVSVGLIDIGQVQSVIKVLFVCLFVCLFLFVLFLFLFCLVLFFFFKNCYYSSDLETR